MNNRLQKVLTGTLFVLLLLPAGFVAAQENNPSEAVTIDALGVERPAVIASNPFYGITDLFRDVKDSFASSSKTDRLRARIDLLNRKAAELLKMREVAPTNAKLLTKALTEYQLAVYQYVFAVEKVEAADIDADKGSSELATALVNTTMLHVRLIDELLSASTTTTNKAVLLELLERFANAGLRTAQQLGIEEFTARLADVPSTGQLAQVRNAEALGLLAKRAVARRQDDLAQQLLQVRVATLDAIADQLVLTTEPAPKQSAATLMRVATVSTAAPIEVQFNEPLVAAFGQLAGSQAERAQTLSYLLSKPELVGNQPLMALRNGLLLEVFAQ